MSGKKRKSLTDKDITTEYRSKRRAFLARAAPLGIAAMATLLGAKNAAAGDGSDSDRAQLADAKLDRSVNNDDRDVPWNDSDTWRPSNLRDGDRFRS